MSDRTLYGRITIATGIAFLICFVFFISCEKELETPPKAEAEVSAVVTNAPDSEEIQKQKEKQREAIIEAISSIVEAIGEAMEDADFD